MPRSTPTKPDRTRSQAQTIRMMERIFDSYQLANDERLTRAAIAKHCAVSEETVRSWTLGRRRPTPEAVRRLAALAGITVLEPLLDLGWLEPSDLPLPAAAPGSGTPVSAAQTAADAVLADPQMRRRFTVTLSTVESGGEYPLTTDFVAQFRLRPGAPPLTAAEAVARARLARLAGPRPGEPPEPFAAGYPDYHTVRLELAAFLKERLRWSGQYTWQGEPDSLVWACYADGGGPAQLLVQDVVSGVSRSAAEDAWTAGSMRTLIFIGGRYASGIAAALTAQELGWQFALIDSGASVDRSGRVGATRRNPVDGPAEAWSEAAAHIAQRARAGRPWQAVVAVRPHSFIGPGGVADLSALEQLRRSPGRVVYVRPHETMLDWWIERQIGLSPHREYAAAAAAHRAELERAFTLIEQALRDRAPDATDMHREDLLLQQERPDEPCEPHRPELPGRLVDDQVRLAWHVVGLLRRTSRHAPVTRGRSLRPGPLADYAAALERDPRGAYPLLA